MQKTKGEHLLAVVKAGLSAFPLVGGPLASLVGDYIPTHTQRSIERMLAELTVRFERLEGRLDPENVNKDEFAELFKSCYLIVVRTHQEEKLRAVAGLLSNILLQRDDPLRLSYTELDHFARCLDTLSIGALKVLVEACDLGSALGRTNADEARFNFEDLGRRMPGMSPELLMGLVGELNAMNLVHLAGVPGIRTARYANYPIELTQLGVRFVRHILGEGAAQG